MQRTLKYDIRNCQSLIGYAQEVHARSGGICAFCDYGSRSVDFDLWRQLTVEHLIGESQSGYLHQIKVAVGLYLPKLSPEDQDRLAGQIHDKNTVSSCSFCNSLTSRDAYAKTMAQLIEESAQSPTGVLSCATKDLDSIRQKKRESVQWKLQALRKAFDKTICPELQQTRSSGYPRSC